MAAQLVDHHDPEFVKVVLSTHPAPKGPDRVDPETGEFVAGELLWEKGIRLHGAQAEIINNRSRFKQLGGGWRFGKSFIGGLEIYLDFVWRWKIRRRTADLWGVLGDSYSMAQAEMHVIAKLLTEAKIPFEMRQPDNQAWKITFPWCEAEIVTLTASDVTKIASKPYRGIVIAEAAQVPEEAFVNARGRVGETRGWVTLEGTFESTKSDWYHRQAIAWSKPGAMGVFFAGPSWDNRVVYPLGMEEDELQRASREEPPRTFREKYGGEPVKRSDMAIEEADDRYHVRHRYPRLKTSYDPEQPVFLWSDPGTAHGYAVFAVQFDGQRANPNSMGNEAWVIDAVYRWNQTAEQIIAECAGKQWAGNVHQAVMDFAARQRRAEGPPIVEQWTKGWREQTGNPLYVVANQVPLAPGYEIHRRALLNCWDEEEAQREFNADGKIRSHIVDPDGPKLYFDPLAAAPMFGGLVDGVSYGGEYNLHHMKKDRSGTVTADAYIDVDNDGVKAVNYGAYHHFGPAGTRHRNTMVGAVPWSMTTR